MEKKISHENMKSLVVAAVIFVIGVLFCCSLVMGMLGLSILIGVSMIVASALYFTNSVMQKKALATPEGVIGAAIFAFGIFFIANSLASLIMKYIPWFLISIGIVIVIDAFLKKFLQKVETIKGFVFRLIFGAACLALGLCLRFVKGFGDYTALVLGIVMIVYAVSSVFNVFIKKGNGEEVKAKAVSSESASQNKPKSASAPISKTTKKTSEKAEKKSSTAKKKSAATATEKKTKKK